MDFSHSDRTHPAVRCPDPGVLKRLVLGRVSGEEAVSLEEHVGECAQCVGVIEELETDDTLVEAVRSARGVKTDARGLEGLIETLSELPTTTIFPNSVSEGDGFAPGQDTFFEPPEESDEIGRMGPYRVMKTLGSGGMGVVFEAEEPELERRVALKVMQPALAASKSARQRFLREARAAASIHDDNVVTIYRVGEHRGLPYVAMERLRGESLADRLEREKERTISQVLQITRQIACGLAAAHRQGVVHRDIKPGNIWLEGKVDGERVKILDFGLARVTDDDVRLTKVGTLAGTPAYMAPEQVQAGPVDRRADLFSLGCVLYEMCTGRLPFAGIDTLSTLMAITQQDPPAPHTLEAHVPRSLSNLIMRLLEKDPGRRMATAEQVVEALDRCRQLPQSASSHPRRRTLVAGVAVLAVTALVLAGIVVYRITNRGTVVLRVAQPNVTVTVDGEPIDVNAEKGDLILIIPGGPHEVRIAKDGFAPHVEQVNVHRGGRTVLQIGLEPKDASAAICTFQGHTDKVRAVAVSADGRLAVSGGYDRVLRLWEVETGRELQQFTGHTGPIRSVDFSSDQHFIVSASEDGTARLWSLEEKREIRRFGNLPSELYCAVFSPDGTQILTGGSDAAVRLWDTTTGRLLKTLKGHTSWVRSVAFSADSRVALSGGNDAVAIIWDLQKGRMAGVLQGHRAVVGGVSLSPDGALAVTGGWDDTIRLWDVHDERELAVMAGPEGTTRRVAFLADDLRVLSGGGPGNLLCLWDLQTGRRRMTFAGHVDEIHDVAVTPDGSHALSASLDHTVRVWRLPSPSPQDHAVRLADILERADAAPKSRPGHEGHVVESHRVFRGHAGAVECVAFSPNGELAVTGGKDATVRLWEIETGREVLQCLGHDDGVLSVAFNSDGSQIVSSSRDGSIRIWDSKTGDAIHNLCGHEAWVTSVAISPDGSSLLSGGLDSCVRLWGVESGGLLTTFSDVAGWIRTVAFLPDGHRIIVAGNDGCVSVWSTVTGQCIENFSDPMSIFIVSKVAVSRDGTFVAAGDWDGMIHVWARDTQRPPLKIPVHRGPAYSVALTPDGQRIVSAGRDHVARVWNAQHGTLLACLEGHTSEVLCVAVSPDGRLALTGSRDETLRLWRLPSN